MDTTGVSNCQFRPAGPESLDLVDRVRAEKAMGSTGPICAISAAGLAALAASDAPAL